MSGRLHTAARVLVVFGLASLSQAFQAGSVQSSEPTILRSPFLRIDDSGPQGTVRVTFEPEAYAAFEHAHQGGGLTAVLSFPLPGGEDVDLLLRPTRVMAADATAIVIAPDGSEKHLAPTVRLFSGSVTGRSSRVFLAISPSLVNGYVELDGENYFLSSGGSSRRAGLAEAAVSHGALLRSPTAADWCGFPGQILARAEPTDAQPALTAAVRETKVFLECDDFYRALFATDQEAVDYCVLLVGAASEIYRRDLGAKLEIPSGYIRVWNSTPPWGITTNFGDLGKFVSWWTSTGNSSRGVKRAAVQLLTAPVFGGVAQGIGSMCTNTSSYAISSVAGFFPYPLQHTSGANWDLFVLSHELGHLYGSVHSFEYVPPIDCKDGSGPDCGTIMSYCHLDYGVGGVGMRFHVREQDAIRGTLRNRGCAKKISIAMGDYDASGVLDALDAAELDAYLLQGFESRGAQETFDMNADGMVTSVDRDILNAIIAGLPPASSVVRNGSGTNCTCYITLSQPVLGHTWTTFVGGYLGLPVLTTIYGTTAPLDPGLPTSYGELLIALPPLGGQTVFRNNVFTNGQWATHAIPLPYSLSLVGRSVYTQAAIFKPTGAELLNAIDLVLSNYE